MRALFVFFFLLITSCAALQPDAAASLQIECNVPEAAVILDDVMLGRASEFSTGERFIRPGFYRVEIRHPNHYTYFAEFDVASGGLASLKAVLHPVLE
jgi:hypothetical protein